jgi:D-alanine-D-alanine ligase-like ATP-grasp enzyme
MNTVYTTTITQAAHRRGIQIDIIDPELPIFELRHGQHTIRCYNGLTDLTGAASFHLTQDKGAANKLLRKHGFQVPRQERFIDVPQAMDFLSCHKQIVVKPVSQWGGRGVSTHISTSNELIKALQFAKKYSDEIVLEECVHGIDWRLIYVNYEFVTAIQRNPAQITGDGCSSIRKLIRKKNAISKSVDPSNVIPTDKETLRTLQSVGFSYDSILNKNQQLQVRRTTNYHTGGSVEIVGENVGQKLIDIGKQIAILTKIPVLGVDILANNDDHYHIIELSPDLAISPPEGYLVVEKFLDYLFPETLKIADPLLIEVLNK